MSIRFIYNTNGEYVAFIKADHLFNSNGDWLGFIRNGNEVYLSDGRFAGYVLDDDRIAKKKNEHGRLPLLPPLRPLRPLTPLRPLKRLKMPRLPNPYEDIFENKNAALYGLLNPIDISKYSVLEGARLVAHDETFLGVVSKNKFHSDSIKNSFGAFGNPYSPVSIFNKYGKYGSIYSLLSPFNQYSTTPPRLIKGGKTLGVLTENKYISNRIDPSEFLIWLDKS